MTAGRMSHPVELSGSENEELRTWIDYYMNNGTGMCSHYLTHTKLSATPLPPEVSSVQIYMHYPGYRCPTIGASPIHPVREAADHTGAMDLNATDMRMKRSEPRSL